MGSVIRYGQWDADADTLGSARFEQVHESIADRVGATPGGPANAPDWRDWSHLEARRVRKREEMKPENIDHGNAEEAWEVPPGAEARQAMIAVAARPRLTAYSDFVAERRGLDLEPQSDHLAHMPDETRRASMSKVSRYGKTLSSS